MDRDEYATEIKILKQKVFDLAREVLGGSAGVIWMYEKILEFSNEVSQVVDNYDAYMSYHILISSSIEKEITPFLEFLPPYSVKNFYLSLLDELSQI